ncbi:MAG: 3-phenylpropionate MFS transporter, partial [Haemophilus haemolyticus]|nr:3-phenylpropionate MFS transporter [Haemophilus haemolyticus]
IAIFTAIAGMIYPTSPAMTFVFMSIIAAAAFFVIPRKLNAFLIVQHK